MQDIYKYIKRCNNMNKEPNLIALSVLTKCSFPAMKELPTITSMLHMD